MRPHARFLKCNIRFSASCLCQQFKQKFHILKYECIITICYHGLFKQALCHQIIFKKRCGTLPGAPGNRWAVPAQGFQK